MAFSIGARALIEKLGEGLYEKPEVNEPEEDLSEGLGRKNADPSFEPKEEQREIESLEPEAEPKDVKENLEEDLSEAVEPELPEEVSEPSIDVEPSSEVIE